MGPPGGRDDERGAPPAADPSADVARRLEGLSSAVSTVIATEDPEREWAGHADVVDGLDTFIRDLAAGLDAADRDDPDADERRALLHRAASLQRDLREHHLRRRSRRRERIEAALHRIRGAGSVQEIIEAGPIELCVIGRYDRAMVSRVRGSTWVPHRLHVAEDPCHQANLALRDYVREAEIPLAEALLEAELVRRRVPALVRDSRAERRTYRPIVELSQSRSYVVAPVIVGGFAIGFFHADTFSSQRPLTDEDREDAQTFADGFSLIFEAAVQAERLTDAHRGVATLLDDDARPDGTRPATHPPYAPATSVPGSASRSDDGLTHLSRREREVLALLARGATNRQIGTELVIADSTVKSHVRSIMRKLQAGTRAEAVARYLRTTPPPREPS